MKKNYDLPRIHRWLRQADLTGTSSTAVVLRSAAQLVLSRNNLDAETFTEANATRFWNSLIKQRDHDLERGRFPLFQIEDPNARTARWHHDSSDGFRNLYLANRPPMMRMVNTLDDRQFEALACIALSLSGATRVHLTPRGTEGGVDFFALIGGRSSCHLFSSTSHPLRIVGQSKRYASPVGPDKMKEFIETIREVTYKSQPKTEAVVPAWFRAYRGPIVGCMFASNGYQSGAVSRAKDHGIIDGESIDLVEMLSLSMSLPEDVMGVARASECKSRVLSLLESTPEVVSP